MDNKIPKYRSRLRMHSTDVKSMKILYEQLGGEKNNWLYEETDEFKDPFSGAYVCNIPKASIEYMLGSNSKLVLHIKVWLYGNWLWDKLRKIRRNLYA